MKAIIDLIIQQWVGVVLSLISFAVAHYYYRRSRQITRLSYQRKSVTLIGDESDVFPKEVKISFSGIDVPRVTSEIIIIWNSGNTTIDNVQISSADKLRIEVGNDNKILKSRIRKVARDANVICLNNAEDAKTCMVGFDFLDPDDGAVLEIIHTGKDKDLFIHGTIKGMKNELQDLSNPPDIAPRGILAFHTNRGTYVFGDKLTEYMMLLAGISLLCAGIFNSHMRDFVVSVLNKKEGTDSSVSISLITIGLLYTVLPIIVSYSSRRRCPAILDIKSRKSSKAQKL